MWCGEVAVLNFINIHLWRVEFLLVFGTVVAQVDFLSFNNWATAAQQCSFTFFNPLFNEGIHFLSLPTLPTNKAKITQPT